MIRALASQITNYLSRSKARTSEIAVPMWMQAHMESLGDTVRNGGRGSDIAAAELRGITTTIMVLGR